MKWCHNVRRVLGHTSCNEESCCQTLLRLPISQTRDPKTRKGYNMYQEIVSFQSSVIKCLLITLCQLR